MTTKKPRASRARNPTLPVAGAKTVDDPTTHADDKGPTHPSQLDNSAPMDANDHVSPLAFELLKLEVLGLRQAVETLIPLLPIHEQIKLVQGTEETPAG